MDVEILKSKRTSVGKLQVIDSHVRFQKFSGSMSEEVQRTIVARPNAAAALIYNTDTEKFLLINQFRYATFAHTGGWITEIVAGKIEEGEDPESCIKREILEEIGYQVPDLVHLSTFFVSPGYTTERIHLYYAKVTNADKIKETMGAENEHEDIQLLEISGEAIATMLDDKKIIDAKTLIALHWAFMFEI